MADHTEFVELALELISEEGRAISLVKIGTDSPDGATPWKGAGTPVVLADTFGCFVPASGSDLGMSWIDSELLRKSTEVCLVPGDEVSAAATILRDHGVDLKVDWVNVLKPADQTILLAFGVSR